MKRDRGKPIAGGDWVKGWYVEISDRHFIVEEQTAHFQWPAIWHPIEVHPASVGMETGLKDKNGKEIYEGDIVKTQHGNYPVGWLIHQARFAAQYGQVYVRPESWNNAEVIGNTTDSPELLKG